MKKLIISFVIAVACNFSITQAQTIKTDLSATKNFTAVNRKVSITKNGDKTDVHLDVQSGSGIAWMNNTNFTSGTIEFDVKGKDIMQQSFVGIAFHGTKDTLYDCIYFRPFNFNATDTGRKSHSVQYISMPQYDWHYLREKFPNKYENSLTNSINANSWFHAKVVVTTNEIKVFVNNSTTPSLTVHPLNNYSTGKVGFWVGNGSDGDFSNLIFHKNS